jgi:hypothetical protein
MTGGGGGIGARTGAPARRVPAAGRRVPAAGFLDLRAVVFLVVAFLAVVFFVVDFLAVAFFVVTFLVVVFLVLVFLVLALTAVFFFVGRAVLVFAAADARERVFGFVRTREVEREREVEVLFAGAFFFGDVERDVLIGIVPPFRLFRSVSEYVGVGACSGMRQMQGGARNPPGAYWVVREEGFRSDNAADDHSWTGS